MNSPSLAPAGSVLPEDYLEGSQRTRRWIVSAVMVTDTAFYRNADYHTAQDTADLLDYPRMARVVQGVHAAVLELVRTSASTG